MKPKFLNLKMFFVIFMAAIFMVAGFGMVGTNNHSKYAIAETEMMASEENSEEVDVTSVVDNWSDFAVSPFDTSGVTSIFSAGIDRDANGVVTKIRITSNAHLAWVAAAVNSGLTTYNSEKIQKGLANTTIELGADLSGTNSLGGKFWTPIGTSSSPFLGTFNGNGHYIDGMMFASSSSANALFGYVNGATIKDVIVRNTLNAGYGLMYTYSSNKPTVAMCASVGVSLLDSSKATVLHSISNGENMGGTATNVSGGFICENGNDNHAPESNHNTANAYNGKFFGVNNFYYMVVRKYNYDHSGGGHCAGDEVFDSEGASSTITIGPNKWGETETVVNIFIYQYGLLSDGNMGWINQSHWQVSDYGQTKSHADETIKINAQYGSSRSYLGIDAPNMDYLPSNGTYTSTRQGAVKVVVEIGIRKVKITEVSGSFYDYSQNTTGSDNYTYSAVDSEFASPTNEHSAIVASANIANVKTLNKVGELDADSSVSGLKDKCVYLGTDIRLGENLAKSTGFAASTSSEGLGSWVVEATSGARSKTLYVNADTVIDNEGAYEIQIYYRIRNIFTITLNNSEITSNNDTKILSASGISTAYIITDYTNAQTKGVLVHNLNPRNETSDSGHWRSFGVASAYITTQNPQSPSMGNTNIFSDSTLVPGDSIVWHNNWTGYAVRFGYSDCIDGCNDTNKWKDVSHEDTLYCAWVLSYVNIDIACDKNILYTNENGIRVYNPYSNEWYKYNGTAYDAFELIIPSTYSVVLINYNENSVAEKYMQISKHSGYLNGTYFGISAFRHSKWQDDSGYGSYIHSEEGFSYEDFEHGVKFCALPTSSSNEMGFNLTLQDRIFSINLEVHNITKSGNNFVLGDQTPLNTWFSEFTFNEDAIGLDNAVINYGTVNNFFSQNFSFAWKNKEGMNATLPYDGSFIYVKEASSNASAGSSALELREYLAGECLVFGFKSSAEYFQNFDNNTVTIVIGVKQGTNRYTIKYVNEADSQVLDEYIYYPSALDGKKGNETIVYEKATMTEYGVSFNVNNTVKANRWELTKFNISAYGGIKHLNVSEDLSQGVNDFSSSISTNATAKITYTNTNDSVKTLSFEFKNFPFNENAYSLGYCDYIIVISMRELTIDITPTIEFKNFLETVNFIGTFDTISDFSSGDTITLRLEGSSIGYELDGQRVEVYKNNVLSYYKFTKNSTEFDSEFVDSSTLRINLSNYGSSNYNITISVYPKGLTINVPCYNESATDGNQIKLVSNIGYQKWFLNTKLSTPEIPHFYFKSWQYGITNTENYYEVSQILYKNMGAYLDTITLHAIYGITEYNITFISDDGETSVTHNNYKPVYVSGDKVVTYNRNLGTIKPNGATGVYAGLEVSKIFKKDGYSLSFLHKEKSKTYFENSTFSSVLDTVSKSYKQSVAVTLIVSNNANTYMFKYVAPNEITYSFSVVYSENWGSSTWWKNQWTNELKDINTGLTLSQIATLLWENIGYLVERFDVEYTKLTGANIKTLIGDVVNISSSDGPSYEFAEQVISVCNNDSYNIVSSGRSKLTTVKLDGTYIKEENGSYRGTYLDVTYVYGTNKNITDETHPAIPTPERPGYTFVYWKGYYEGKEYTIYGEGDARNSVIDEDNIILYAYWKVVGVSIISDQDNTEFDYNASAYTVTYNIVNVPDNMQNNFGDLVTVSKKQGTACDNDVVKYAVKLYPKYVAHSGEYVINFIYSFSYDYSPNSANFILVEDGAGNLVVNKTLLKETYTTVSLSTTLKVNPKQLVFMKDGQQFNGSVSKVYDANNVVSLEGLTGIFGTDLSAYKIDSATYSSVNVGENLDINYNVTTSNSLVRGSYILPQNKGAITPYKIYVSLAGSTIKNNQAITLLDVGINSSGLIYTNSLPLIDYWDVANTGGYPEISLHSQLKTLASSLVGGGTLKLKITASGIAKTYKESDLDILFEVTNNLNQDITNNFELDFENTSFRIGNVPSGYSNFDIVAIRDDGNADVSSIVNSITMNNATQITNHKISYSKLNSEENTFVVSASFKNYNWWVNKIRYRINAGEYVTLTIPSVFADANGNGVITFTLPQATKENIYEIEILFTRTSRVNFELGLFDKESAIVAPNEQSINNGEGFTFPNAQRYGLTLTNWFYIDGVGNKVSYKPESYVTWQLRGDITLFAEWNFNAEIVITGSNVSAKYDSEKSYKFTASVKQTVDTNEVLKSNYSTIWYKDNKSNAQKSLSISAKNVTDSGKYFFEFSILDIPVYNNGVSSIIMNVTYKYSDATPDSTKVGGYYYNVVITPKEITLKGNIDKQFDGTASIDYTVKNSDVVTVDRELVGKNLRFTYSSADVDSTINNTISLGNYIISANGTIVVRDVNLYINTTAIYNKNGNTLLVADSYEIGTDNIIIEQLYIKTTGVNVGVYNKDKLSVDKDTFKAKVNIGNITPKFEYFNFIFVDNSKIEIVPAPFNGRIVLPALSFVYNTKNQNLGAINVYDSEIGGNNITANSVITVLNADRTTFNGARNVGSYSIIIKVTNPNYTQIPEINKTLVITPYSVYIDFTSNITKTYDGNVDMKNLYYGTDYNLYNDSSKTLEVNSDYLKELICEDYTTQPLSKWWLKYEKEDANTTGDSYLMSLYLDTKNNLGLFENYSISVLQGGSLRGTITRRDVTLTINSEKYYDGNDFVLTYIGLGELYASGLVNEEAIISNKSTITFVDIENAGTYVLDNTFNFVEALELSTNELLSKNYNINLTGKIVINKSVVTINLTKSSYEYKDAVQTVEYSATRSDLQNVTNIVVISANEGVNVGNHPVTFEITSNFQNNYTFVNKTDTFVTTKTITIVKKDLNLEVNATKLYNGTNFTHYLSENYKDVNGQSGNLTNLLIQGHSFDGLVEGQQFRSYLKTSGTFANTYSRGYLECVVKVFGKNGDDVSENYNIIFDNTKLTITKAFISESDVTNRLDSVYNGNVQNIKFTIFGEDIEFKGDKSNATYNHIVGKDINGQDITIVIKFARQFASGTTALGDFKYAGDYEITVESSLFANSLTFVEKISPIVIAKEDVAIDGKTGAEITADILTRQYDGTTGFQHSLTSNKILEVDKDYIKLSARYTNVFGPNNSITVNFSNVGDGTEEETFRFGSYVLKTGINFIGEITKRIVTISYTQADTFYYNTKCLSLPLSKFKLEGNIESQVFDGTLIFENIIDANETTGYDLASQNYKGLTLNRKVGNVSLENELANYYTIVLQGNVKINRAEVMVGLVYNNTHEYNGTSKTVSTIASIYNNRGAIASDIIESLLTTSYKKSTSEGYVTAVNVGSYYIYPEISSLYTTNYKYADNEGFPISQKLVITPKPTVILANIQLVNDNRTSYSFEELNAVASEAVSGHIPTGTITLPIGPGTYKYITTTPSTITTGVSVNDVNIVAGGVNVTGNYELYYDITVEITDDLVEGQIRVSINDFNYVYDAENQLDRIGVVFETLVGGCRTKETIFTQKIILEKFNIDGESASIEETVNAGKIGQLGKLIGFYLTKENAVLDNANANMLTEIINAGTYFAKVQKYNFDDGAFETDYIYVEFDISRRTISNLKLDGIVFNGTKTYDAKLANTLTSSDVSELDKDDDSRLKIVATFNNANYGERIVTISLSGSMASNYVLLNSSFNGSINPRTVTITNYNGNANRAYNGTAQNIIVSHDMLTATGLVDGHELYGNITLLSVTDVGKYSINGENAVNGLDIYVSGAGYTDDYRVTSNYKFKFSENLNVEISCAVVSVGWNASNKVEYCAEDNIADVIQKLIYTTYNTISDIALAKADIKLSFTYTDNSGHTKDTTEIKDAGTYVIKSAESFGNFKYNIDPLNNIIKVTKKDVTINLDNKIVKYIEYKEFIENNPNGYEILYSYVVGGCEQDKELFEQGSYYISVVDYMADTQYNYAKGEIEVKQQDEILNNYNLSYTGYIKLLAEELIYEKTLKLTYNGKDRLADLEIIITDEQGQEQIITTSTDSSIGKIIGAYVGKNKVELKDAGEYVVKFERQTAVYAIDVSIDKLAITGFSNLVQNKTYDGNNIVFNTDGTTEIYGNEVIAGDDVKITAEYLASATTAGSFVGEHGIKFIISGEDANNYDTPQNFIGQITAKDITVDLGSFEVVYNNLNSYEFKYTAVLSSLASGDSIEDDLVKFTLSNNKAVQNLELNKSTAVFDLSKFTIFNSETVDVTNCYNIEIIGNITVVARRVVVNFVEFKDSERVYEASEKQVKYTVEAETGTLTDVEKDEILSFINVFYTKDGLSAKPLNVGSYVATAEYKGPSYYSLVGTVYYSFDISKYIFDVEKEGVKISSFEKQYYLQDPELTQTFTKEFANGAHTFTVQYIREPGTEIKQYNLIDPSTKCENISFVCAGKFLANKFRIVQNTTTTVTLEVTGHNSGGLTRYYGKSNIGVFDINELVYTAKVDGDPVTTGEISGSIIYAGKNVGSYDVENCEIVATKANFTKYVATNTETGKLIIAKRTVEISSDDYSKYYDGTNEFIGELKYNFNSVTAATEGKLSDQEIDDINDDVVDNVVVIYEESNAGNKKLFVNFVVANPNFNLTLAQNEGEIKALDINVTAQNQSAVYGDDTKVIYNVEYAVNIGNNYLSNEDLINAVSATLEGKSANLSTSQHAKVGVYNVIFEVNNLNFNIVSTPQITYEVVQKEVNVTFNNKPFKEQDGNTSVDLTDVTYDITGEFENDDVYIESASYDTSHSGVNKTIYITFGGVDGGNYKATSLGDIGQRIIKFNLQYYYENCNPHIASLNDIKEDSRSIDLVEFDYYANIDGSLSSLPTPLYKNNGVKFVGWGLIAGDKSSIISRAEPLNTVITPYEKEVKLYAIWETAKFNVTIEIAKYDFDENDYNIEVSSPILKEYKENIVIEDYVQQITNYVYIGVGVNNTNKADGSMLTYTVEDTDVKLYLMYKPLGVTVKFNANGGSFKNKEVSLTYVGMDTATFTIYNGQKIGAIINAQNLEKCLDVSKVGYSNPVWQLNGADISFEQIAAQEASAGLEFVVSWTANEYTLTIDAGEGEFEAVDSAIWTEVAESDGSVIYATIAYDSIIPQIPTVINTGYRFVKYIDETGKEWNKEKWDLTDNITITAVFEDCDYVLTITTINTTIEISAVDSTNAPIQLNSSTVENKIIYSVKTSYTVIIIATPIEGYELPQFVDANNAGVANENKYTISLFANNLNIEVSSTPKQNKVTLKVNDNKAGSLVYKTFSSNKENEFTASTGTELDITAVENEGYKFKSISLEGTGKLIQDEKTAKVTGFTGDIIIYAEFEPIDLSIKVINPLKDGEVAGTYSHGLNIYNQGEQLFIIKTGEDFVIKVTPNTGFDVRINSLEFKPTNSTNKGTITYEKQDNDYIITLSGITASGELEIIYSYKQFTITFGYVEFNEITNSFDSVPNGSITQDIVEIDGVGYTVGETFSEEFGTSITVVAKYNTQGFKLYGFVYYKDGEFTNVGGSFNKQNGTITFKIDANYSLYLAYERVEYTVTYKVNNEALGSIGYSVKNEIDYKPETIITKTVRYGRNVEAVVKATPISEFVTFNGWKIEGQTTYLTTEQEFTAESPITSNVTFIAELVGNISDVTIIIKANSKENIAQDVNNILNFKGNAYEYTAKAQNDDGSSLVDENQNNIVKITLSYNAYDTISFSLNIESYFDVISQGRVVENNFVITNLNPQMFDKNNAYVIDLALKYYNVIIKTEATFDRAAKISNTNSSIGLDYGLSSFEPNGVIIASVYVQYKGTLGLNVEVSNGYSYVGASDENFVLIGGDVVLENITANKEITLYFTKTKYKITFHTNYPTDYIEASFKLQGVVNKEFTFYVEQDGSVLKNKDGSVANIQELLDRQDYKNSESYSIDANGKIEFMFKGWSVVPLLGEHAKRYGFSNNKIGDFDEISKPSPVYGFNDCLFDADGDGNPDIEDGYVVTNLYATWKTETSKVFVEYVPNKAIYDGNESLLFNIGTTGVIQKLSSDDGDHAVRAAYGVPLTMLAPNIPGYVYYGWKLNDEKEINTQSISFNMLPQDVTIKLYYKFKVTVNLQESIAGVNDIKVNGELLSKEDSKVIELLCLYEEEISLEALVGTGFEWGYWLQDNDKVDAMLRQCIAVVYDTTTFTAVFLGKQVELVLREVPHVILSLKSDIARVGDTIEISVISVDFGYTLQGIAINEKTVGVNADDFGKIYTYMVVQDDAEQNADKQILYIDAIVKAREVNVEFKLNIKDSVEIKVNNEDVTGKTVSYSYGDTLNVVVKSLIRYELVSITQQISAQDVKTLETTMAFALVLTRENGFALASQTDYRNVITFNSKALLWRDEASDSLQGNGTETTPYLISSAEHLARMMIMINGELNESGQLVNQIDQTINRIYFKIMADINLSERFWEPIGTENHNFISVFDLGKYKIKGAEHLEEHKACAWDNLYECKGVFEYLGNSAEIIIERSILPTLILVLSIVVVVLAIGAIVVIIIYNKRKKIKKLSGNLAVSKATRTSISNRDESVVNEVNIANEQELEQKPMSMDDEVQKILEKAQQKQADNNTNE